jgi:hypothetical protein
VTTGFTKIVPKPLGGAKDKRFTLSWAPARTPPPTLRATSPASRREERQQRAPRGRVQSPLGLHHSPACHPNNGINGETVQSKGTAPYISALFFDTAKDALDRAFWSKGQRSRADARQFRCVQPSLFKLRLDRRMGWHLTLEGRCVFFCWSYRKALVLLRKRLGPRSACYAL